MRVEFNQLYHLDKEMHLDLQYYSVVQKQHRQQQLLPQRLPISETDGTISFHSRFDRGFLYREGTTSLT